MLYLIRPRHCRPTALGRLGCQRTYPRAHTPLGCCAQDPQQGRTTLSSYQEILRERLVKGLGELAKSLGTSGGPASKERRREGEQTVRKLLREGSSLENVHLSAYHIAETVHALCVLGSHEHFEKEMEMLLQIAASKSKKITAARTIRLLHSAAKASHHSPAVVMLAASTRLVNDLSETQPQCVSLLLWALAILNIRPRATLDRLQAIMPATVKAASGNKMLLLCWTLAVLEETGSEAFQIPWKALAQKQQEEIGISPTDATLYCQVIEELKISGQRRSLCAWHQALYEKYLDSRMEVLQREERTVSSMHKDVMTAVELSGTYYVEEAILGIYAVDIALPEYKVVIEVDGPSHFTRTRPRRTLGPTLMKHRHLEGAGWVVVSVCSDDWNQQESWQQKMCLLRDLFYRIERERLEAGS